MYENPASIYFYHANFFFTFILFCYYIFLKITYVFVWFDRFDEKLLAITYNNQKHKKMFHNSDYQDTTQNTNQMLSYTYEKSLILCQSIKIEKVQRKYY